MLKTKSNKYDGCVNFYIFLDTTIFVWEKLDIKVHVVMTRQKPQFRFLYSDFFTMNRLSLSFRNCSWKLNLRLSLQKQTHKGI